MHNIVASLHSIGQRVTTYISIVVGITVLILVVGPVGLVVGRDGVGVAEVSIVDVATHNPVPAIQREVEGCDAQGTSHIIILRTRRAQGVAEGVAVVATQADAQALDGIVVDAHGTSVVVGHLELIGTGGAIVYEVLGREAL